VKIRKGLKRDVEVQSSNKGGQPKLESQSKSSWNPIWIPRTVGTKIITLVTYQLRFGRSLYGWKAKRITFPMELVTHVNYGEVHRICHGSLYGWKAKRITFPMELVTHVNYGEVHRICHRMETMRCTESVTVLCYHILAPWAMYQVGPNRGTS
jgi:hypothetical protein